MASKNVSPKLYYFSTSKPILKIVLKDNIIMFTSFVISCYSFTDLQCILYVVPNYYMWRATKLPNREVWTGLICSGTFAALLLQLVKKRFLLYYVFKLLVYSCINQILSMEDLESEILAFTVFKMYFDLVCKVAGHTKSKMYTYILYIH